MDHLAAKRVVVLIGKRHRVLPGEQPAEDALPARGEPARLVVNAGPAERVDHEVIA
jgi:hypothetical protein